MSKVLYFKGKSKTTILYVDNDTNRYEVVEILNEDLHKTDILNGGKRVRLRDIKEAAARIEEAGYTETFGLVVEKETNKKKEPETLGEFLDTLSEDTKVTITGVSGQIYIVNAPLEHALLYSEMQDISDREVDSLEGYNKGGNDYISFEII